MHYKVFVKTLLRMHFKSSKSTLRSRDEIQKNCKQTACRGDSYYESFEIFVITKLISFEANKSQ